MIGSRFGFFARQRQAVSLLLDDYPAILAPSVRKISSTYSGNDMNVRESSGNTEQEIGYTDNDLDTTALLAHTGANDGFVDPWFDPSGNGYDFSQTAAIRQPQIVDAGSVITAGTRPTLSLNGGGMKTVSAVDLGGASEIWLFLVVNVTDNSTPQWLYETSQSNAINNGSIACFIFGGVIRLLQNNSGSRVSVDTPLPTGLQLITINFKGNQSDTNAFNIYFNGLSRPLTIGLSGTSPATYANYVHYLGARDERINPVLGDISEAILMTGDQSANREAIETNINQYFNLYWDGSQTSLLDDYSGAVAGYSLRALSSSYTGPLIRVRRSSDNAEQDVYAKYDSSLNTTALEDFCAATDGFVTTWYDQSGNGNDASQTTAAKQTKIYDSSTGVITENGKAAIDFSVASDGMELASHPITDKSNFYITTVCRYDSNDVVAYNFADSDDLFSLTFGRSSANTYAYLYVINSGATTTINGDSSNSGEQHLFEQLISNEVQSAYADNSLATGTNTGRGNYNANFIGSRANAQSVLDGKMQELIIWNIDQSANRGNIETNINDYYGIY